MVHANLLGRLSRLIAPTPVVISTMHNENEGAQWRYLAYRLTNPLSDVTTAVGRVAQLEAERRGAAPAGSIQVVPNGLATAPYERDEPTRARMRAALDLGDGFTWLAVGRLAESRKYRVRRFHGVQPPLRLKHVMCCSTRVVGVSMGWLRLRL